MKKMSKLLSVMLSVLLLVTSVPMTGFAAEHTAAEDTVVEDAPAEDTAAEDAAAEDTAAEDTAAEETETEAESTAEPVGEIAPDAATDGAEDLPEIEWSSFTASRYIVTLSDEDMTSEVAAVIRDKRLEEVQGFDRVIYAKNGTNYCTLTYDKEELKWIEEEFTSIYSLIEAVKSFYRVFVIGTTAEPAVAEITDSAIAAEPDNTVTTPFDAYAVAVNHPILCEAEGDGFLVYKKTGDQYTGIVCTAGEWSDDTLELDLEALKRMPGAYIIGTVSEETEEPEFYAVRVMVSPSTPDDTDYTMAFYYDTEKAAHTEGIVFDQLPAEAVSAADWKNYYREDQTSIRNRVTELTVDENLQDYTGLKSTAYMCQGLIKVTKLDGFEYLNVSEVTNMSCMFQNCGSGNQEIDFVPDVSNWDTGRVTVMDRMFMEYAASAAGPIDSLDLSGWKITELTSADQMFYGYAARSASSPAVYAADWSEKSGVYAIGMFAGSSLKGSTDGGWSSANTSAAGCFSSKTADIAACTADEIEDRSYTGSAIEPAVTVRDGEAVLVLNKDYTVSYADNIEVGQAAVIITGVGKYAGTKTVYFNITARRFTVSFDSNGGSAVESQTVAEGEKVSRPEKPAKSGYTFINWYNGTKVWDFDTAVTADVTLTAKWTSNTSDSSDSSETVQRTTNQSQGSLAVPATGVWHQDEYGFWYFGNEGVPSFVNWGYIQSGAQRSNNWFYFDQSGKMQTGFHEINESWYYFAETKDANEGKMAIGWNNLQGIWYYFDPAKNSNEGKMTTGWKFIDSQWYCFASSGAMYENTTTPDGYRVDANGVWVQ